MADETLAELNQWFGSGAKALEADAVAELQSIMRLHQLSVQDLFFKWESYGMKMGMDDFKASVDNLRAFKQNLQDELERTNRSQVHIKTEKRAGATPRVAKGGDVFGMLDGLATPGPGRAKAAARRTPAVARARAEPASSPLKVEDQLNAMGAIPPSSFNDRQNPGEVLEILNEQLDAAEPPISPFSESRVKLTAASDQKKLGYKGLAMKLSEASEILDDRIDDFVGLVTEHHKLDDSAFGSPASQGTTEIVAVGRIASDSLEGKLNAASLVLETSRRMGNGLRVPLNLGKLKGYQFFPGQIVALKGINTSGRDFTVHEVLDIPLLPNAASAPDALSAHLARLRGAEPDAMDSDDTPSPPLTILFASGPYTADDNLDFEPLHTLCSEAADIFADAVVLTGPFIDMEHPLIAAGDFDLPPEASYDPDTATMTTVFKYLVSPALNRLVAANPSVTVLLIPSVRDVLDKHVSWPQDAFPRRELGLHKTVRIIGNPMTLSINEMVLGISSQDALWELRHEELVGGARAGDALSRVSRYLVEQRHFFPLFPSADRKRLPKTGAVDGVGGGVPPGAMLDVSYLKLGEMVNVRPDVLVVPSALPPFAKVVESVLVINPGYLSKRKAAGTYAKMTLYPPSQEDISSDGMVAHKIFERARVEITRI
ncbi:DNA polymerase alpha subunit B N-terminal-domain-containing protein [Parachaetomium inaequale]|uniref:DNA polymerase alpha subunit B n=1 Tax=Parachaetomium inaequale TaxID=2588326 RepID=A0AAN6PFK3_9PEZI|nr:DNA polymerase alpha subunit B N-terminal-domain-containing protein [Parachaetomium inaequale]